MKTTRFVKQEIGIENTDVIKKKVKLSVLFKEDDSEGNMDESQNKTKTTHIKDSLIKKFSRFRDTIRKKR